MAILPDTRVNVLNLNVMHFSNHDFYKALFFCRVAQLNLCTNLKSTQ